MAVISSRFAPLPGDRRFLESVGVASLGDVMGLGGRSTEHLLMGEMLEKFTHMTDDMLCVAGVEGFFKYLSPSWERVLGWTLAELCARPFVDFVHPEDRARTTQETAAIVQAGRVQTSFRNRYRCRDGGYRWLLWRTNANTEDGLIYAAARDVTDMVALEGQRDELMALIVHDLKSPLSVIKLNAQWLLGELQGAQEESARDIVGAAECMERLVLNLLDVSRSDERNLVPQLKEVLVKDLMSAIYAAAKRRADALGKKLLIRLPARECRVHADRDLLRRVLENLLDNSLKYSHVGATIQLEARETSEEGVEFTVADDGPGIPATLRHRIFEKYARLDDGANAPTGHGLGLVFCRLAVEAHRGTIGVEEGVPRGTVFRVRLPR
ncbi:MAG: PAS domain-containing sensor histidine kinase [Myxococcota bacterium]